MHTVRGALTAFLAVLTAAGYSYATQIDPSLNFRRTVANAGVIFAGTVDHIRVEMHPSGRYPVTRVVFKHLRIVTGQPTGRDSLEITLWGGRVGSELYETPGQPEFQVGQRCVIFASPDLGAEATSYIPIVGMNRGLFYVIQDSTGQAWVHDWERRPIVRIERNHLVVLGARRGPAPHGIRPPERQSEPPIEVLSETEDPGARISEDAFLRAIVPFMK